MDWANLIAVITLLVGGGGFLYYSQNKASKEIANASALAAEWEKLYREQKSEREENDAEVSCIRPYICYNQSCANRITINKKLKNSKDEKFSA